MIFSYFFSPKVSLKVILCLLCLTDRVAGYLLFGSFALLSPTPAPEFEWKQRSGLSALIPSPWLPIMRAAFFVYASCPCGLAKPLDAGFYFTFAGRGMENSLIFCWVPLPQDVHHDQLVDGILTSRRRPKTNTILTVGRKRIIDPKCHQPGEACGLKVENALPSPSLNSTNCAHFAGQKNFFEKKFFDQKRGWKTYFFKENILKTTYLIGFSSELSLKWMALDIMACRIHLRYKHRT